MKTFKITALAAILIVPAGAAAHHAYEQHLSAGYAPILRAALDPHASQADEDSYLRSARVAVRTDKDRETQDKLDQAFQYAAENCDGQFRESVQLSGQSFEASMYLFRTVPSLLPNQAAVAYAKSKELYAQSKAADKAFKLCSAGQARDNKIALTMFQELALITRLKPK
jgi:hypothetical protein